MSEPLAPDRVAEMVKDGGAQLVDVRTDEEWEAGHAPEARHIPIDRLTAEAESLDRSRPVVLSCRGGDRSSVAAEAFEASGWQASSMDGGLVAWADRGLPLEPEDGEVADRKPLPPA